MALEALPKVRGGQGLHRAAASREYVPTGHTTGSVGPVAGMQAEPARQGVKSVPLPAMVGVPTAQYMPGEGGQGLQAEAFRALSVPRGQGLACALPPVHREPAGQRSCRGMSEGVPGPQ